MAARRRAASGAGIFIALRELYSTSVVQLAAALDATRGAGGMLRDMSERVDRNGTGHFHAVRFYENKAALCRTVADFLAEGFALGQPGLVIATPDHREALLAELRERDIDIDRLEAEGDFLCLDARSLLARFMVDGMPHAEMFTREVSAAIDRVARGRVGRTIRAYGEMVDVLWQDGFTAAAIRLEVLWNELAATRDFSLLCGYAMGSFYKDTGMREVCDQHTHVMPAERTLQDRSLA